VRNLCRLAEHFQCHPATLRLSNWRRKTQ
jgi:hypothetical protein